MNEKLIDDLAQGLEKSRKTWTHKQLLAFMLLFSILCSLITTFVIGLRFDIERAFEGLDFRLELFLLASLALSAYFMAARTAIPGLVRAPRPMFWAILFVIAVLCGLFLRHPAHPEFGEWSGGWHCFALIMANAFFPTLLALWMIRRQAATTRPLLTMAFVLLGSLATAVAVQHLLCKIDDPWHLVIWHLGVLPVALLLARVLGHRVLRW